MAGLNKEYSPKPAIQRRLKAILEFLRTRNASVIVQWISTTGNVPADTLTRSNLGDAFQLNTQVFTAISTAVNGLDIDRFATAGNKLMLPS